MAGLYHFYGVGNDGDDDFDEEDVWAVVREKNGKDCSSTATKPKESPLSVSRHLPSAARMIPRSQTAPLGVTLTTLEQSAPVSIPDWSKIYGANGTNSYPSGDVSWEGGGGDEEDDGGGRIPPHEWLARKLARSQISSFSVCEGAGRTLKGRDLSKMRNVVLTKTGFLE